MPIRVLAFDGDDTLWHNESRSRAGRGRPSDRDGGQRHAEPGVLAVRTIIFEALEPHPEIRSEISRRLRLLAEKGEDEAS
jgi:hypothetical protein